MDFSATAARLVCPEVTLADALIQLTLEDAASCRDWRNEVWCRKFAEKAGKPLDLGRSTQRTGISSVSPPAGG